LNQIARSQDHRRRLEQDAATPWWMAAGVTPWAAYAAKGAASLAASYTDLSGNGHDCAPGVAPTWDVTNGWTFNGSNQYLTTAFIPETNQSQSMFVRFTNLTLSDGKALCGAYVASNRDFRIYGQNYPPVRVTYCNGGIRGGSVYTAGIAGIAGAYGYYNGVVDSAAIGGWGAAITAPVYIGCRNNNGSPSGYAVLKCQAFILFDVALTEAAAGALCTAMAAL
jgi:hypothetical protein